MKKKTVYLLFPLLSLCACSGESDALLSESQGEPIVLSGSIGELSAESVSRAPIESTHATAMEVGFGRVDQTGVSTWSAWSGATLLRATRAAANGTAAITFNAANKQYYTTGTSNNGIKFVGWYPANAVSSGKVTFPIDGKTDVMWTSAQTGYATRGDGTSDKFGSSNKVFDFAHQLARVTVKAYGDAQASTNWGTITSVKVLNTPNTVTMTLADTPTPAFGTANQTIPLKNISTDADVTGVSIALTATTQAAAATCGYAMLAPASSYQLEVTTTKGGTRKVTVTNAFDKSKHYTVYLNFQSTEIEPSATIGSWTTGGGTPTGGFPNNE
ncbi:hypothetical protein [Bacteroides sp.]